MRYGDKRLFALLSLIFTFVDLRNQFHIDHFVPISRFTAARLRRSGVPEEEIDALADAANQLSNLQLLEGSANIEKRAAWPTEWLQTRYPNKSDREHYCSIHLLGDPPGDITDSNAFWSARRERLRKTIESVLNQ
jgi:hypothetical protein